MARDAYLEHLARIPLFADCTRKELAEIASVGTELRFTAGSTLLHRGSTAHELLVITDGEAEVVRDGEVVARLGTGEVVGELALVLDRPRNADVRAATDLEALVIDRRSFEPLLDDVHGLAKRLLFTVARRLSEAVPEHH